MRPSRSRSRSFVALGFAAAWAVPRVAGAQPCCSGATALTPARLALHEDVLVGVVARGTWIYGSFDPAGTYVPASSGAAEVDLEQDAVAAVRVAARGQASISLPLVETYRRVASAGEWGGGVGDVVFGARWDFVEPGHYVIWPGVAVSGTMTLPSGRPAEEATNTQATDATGAGAFQLGAGLSLEQTFGHVLVHLTGSLAWRDWRLVGRTRVHDGLGLSVLGAAGWTFDDGAALALTASYSVDGAPEIDGVTVRDAGRAHTRLGVIGGRGITDRLRLQGGVFGDLPIPHLGHGQPIGLGSSLALLLSWS